MKKLLAILLMLLMGFTACAEEAIEAAEEPDFTLRNGITWGMSQEEVLQAEGNPRHETDEDDGVKTIEIDDVKQGGARCDVEYAFMDDALFMATFEYDTKDGKVSFDGLKETLAGLYGVPGAFNDNVKSLLDKDDLDELDNIASWTLDNGTDIWLMEDQDDDSIEVIFVELGW